MAARYADRSPRPLHVANTLLLQGEGDPVCLSGSWSGNNRTSLSESFPTNTVGGGAYARAKLANALYARHLPIAHPGWGAVSVHPGMVFTPMAQKIARPYAWMQFGLEGAQDAFMSLMLRPPAAAAAVVLTAAKRLEEMCSGGLCESPADGPNGGYANGLGEILDHNHLPAAASDAEVAARLWDVSASAVANPGRRSAAKTDDTFTFAHGSSSGPAAPYHRGPWPRNPSCSSSVLLDPPGSQRGVSLDACPKSTGEGPNKVKGETCSEYAYFASVTSASDCAETCCADWSCWAFTFYPMGRNGSNNEPQGPGHSCDGSGPCCVLLNDMHDAVVKSPLPHTQSGVRAKLPARWDPTFRRSTLVRNVSFGDKLFIGGQSVYPKGHHIPQPTWSLGDEFPTTWADDGFQYSGAGDNSGGDAYPATGSPLTLWRIAGREPPAAKFNLQGVHIPINSSRTMQACPIRAGRAPNLKSQSLLALGKKLFWAVACFDYHDSPEVDVTFSRQRYGVNDTSWIVSSDDNGVTWDLEATDFHFFRGRLSSPRFINAGQGYKDAPDPDHIYALFPGTETDKAFFENNDAIWLGRVPTAQLLNRSAWTFYAGDVAGEPAWTVDDTIAVSILRHPLMTATQQVTYNVGLKRYMMAVWGWVDPNGNPRGQLTSSNTEGRPWEQPSSNPSVRGRKDGHDRTQLSLWEAPQPWGPWSYFHRDDDWRGPDGSSGGYTPVFPPAWISESGTEMWMVFTQCCPGKIAGPPNNYNFTYQRLDLTTATGV